MFLTRLQLDEFRVYRHLDLAIAETGLRLSGRNASGKTSLIEAISIASTSRSPRARADRELVRWGSGDAYGVPPYARIVADLEDRSGEHRLELALEQDAASTQLFRKKYRLDGNGKRAHDIVGTVKTVLFSPEDVQLVSGPPSERRRQIDMLLSQIDREYLLSLSRFGRVLSNRNGLLKAFLRDKVDHRSPRATAELGFWDEQLIAHGAEVVARRESMLASLSGLVASRADYLIEGANLTIAYAPRVAAAPDEDEVPLAARVQQVRAAYAGSLLEHRAEEFRRGVTVVGPHRDEVAFHIDGRDLAAFGSRGQQRLAVIAYKMAETDLIGAMTGERPILLLDDVLSELDRVHRDMLLEAVSSAGNQIIVTSTDEELLQHPGLNAIPEAHVDSGVIALT